MEWPNNAPNVWFWECRVRCSHGRPGTGFQPPRTTNGPVTGRLRDGGGRRNRRGTRLLSGLGPLGKHLRCDRGGGLTLGAFVPVFREAAFWIWVLVFYLFTLTLEVLLLRGRRPA